MTDYIIIGLLIVNIFIMTWIWIKSRKYQIKDSEISELNTTQNDFKIYLQKEYGEFRYQLSQMINESNKLNHNDLNDFKEGLLKSVEQQFREINSKVEQRLEEGLDKTNKTFINVIERLAKIDEAQKKIEDLSTEVVSLNDLLKGQKLRGIFGEGQLYQILSSVFGDKQYLYAKQKTLSNQSVVDAVIYAPDPLGLIPIDAKFPLENYKKMFDQNLSEYDRNLSTKEFKNNLKKHINDIKDKYIIPLETADYALMFIPAEAVFSEIYAHHEDVVDYASKSHVWLTSPTTLIYMLSMILLVSQDIERNKATSQIITELKKLGEEFKRYADRWTKLRKSLETVTNQAKDVHVTTEKISSRFQNITSVQFDELSSENEADEPYISHEPIDNHE